MDIGVKFLKGLKYSVAFLGMNSILYTKYIDSQPYSNLYEQCLQRFDPNRVQKIHRFLLSIGLIHAIHPEKYEPYLNGRLNDIYLPNILGLGAGYETHGNNVPELFSLGFGYLEVGSLNPQTNIDTQFKDQNKIQYVENKEGNSSLQVSYENDAENQSVLKAKAYIGSHKKNMQNDYFKQPIGANVTPNAETKAYTPYLCEQDLISSAQDMLQVSDYVVLNLQGPSKGMEHLLTIEKMKEIISEIKRERIQNYGVEALYEYEQYEVMKKQNGKITPNKIYSTEVYGKPVLNKQVFTPQIYLKLSEKDQIDIIEQFAKNYKEIGIEGFVIVGQNNAENNNKSLKNLRKITQFTNGNIPLISVGGINTPQEVISRIKNGASSVQICSQVYLKGPKYIETFLQNIVDELKTSQKVDQIKQLRNVDIE